MTRWGLTLVALLGALSVGSRSAQAQGYDGARREEVDAGVHTPVLTRAPELLHFVQAPYPQEAKEAGLTAVVKMQVTIDAEGGVSDVKVLEPVGHGFDEAAEEAVWGFRFSPAEVDGVPAPVQIEYVHRFTLEPPAPPAEAAPPPPPPATLTGQLLARGSRSTVEGGTVRCGDEADAPEAQSDAQGRFTLPVPAGRCALRVVAQGFRLFKAEEELEAGETKEVVLYLQPEAVGYETVVRADRDKKEVVRRSVQRQELQKVPGTFGDALRVLQNFPGVARVPFSGGALIVRGAAPDQTLTFLDGVEVPLLFHLGGGPSVINSEFLERIDFYPGGFGSRYGRAVGGVVDVATRKGAADTLHGSVKVDLLDAGFFVEAPLGNGVSVAGAARRSYVDTLLPLVLPQDPEGGTLAVLPAYWDYQARVDFGQRGEGTGPRSTGYLMAFGSEDILNVVATGGGRNRDLTVDTKTLFHRLKGDWTYRHGAFTSAFTPFAGYDLSNFDLGNLAFRADTYSLGGRQLFQYEVSEALVARAGVDALFEHVRGVADLPVQLINYIPFPGDNPEVEIQRVERVANGFDGALFAEVDLKLGPVLLTPGVRGTYVRKARQERTTVDPRLFARWQASDAFALKSSVGLYSQAPTPFELQPLPYGNASVSFERAFQASLGVEQRFSEVLSADVTGFFNRRFDLIVQPGLTVENEGGGVTREVLGNYGLGRAYGLEVLVRHDVTRNFFGWLAYTLNRSEQRRQGGDGYQLTTFDQTHILTAVGSYRLPFWDVEVGARYRFVTGRPTTGLVGGADIYQADANSYSGTFGPTNGTRFAPFHQLDVRLDKSFVFDRWTLNVYVDVQNVYNATNVEATLYDYRYRNTFDVPGVPFLPVLGVKGSF